MMNYTFENNIKKTTNTESQQDKNIFSNLFENKMSNNLLKNMGSTNSDSVNKIYDIVVTLENDPDFIKIKDDELVDELNNIPQQQDFDSFCKRLNYNKKLSYTNSEDYEKLYTILYTIGNYCYKPKENLKTIVLSVIKFELLRNRIIQKINRINDIENTSRTLDCITSDMLFVNLGYFVPHDLMTIISKNLAYYFSKIYQLF